MGQGTDRVGDGQVDCVGNGQVPNELLSAWIRAADLTRSALREAIIKKAADRGEAIDVSTRTIARWVNEGDQPRAPLPELLAEVISARVGEKLTPLDLGFAWFRPAAGAHDTDRAADLGTPGTPAERVEVGEVLRRQVLRLIAAQGVMSPAVRDALGHARALMDAALQPSGRPGSVAVWEATALQYGRGYNGVPPAKRLAAVTADFISVQAHLDRPLMSATRSQMCTVAARLAGTNAIVLHDMGDAEESRGWFATAASAAREGEDPRVLAWVWARQAMVEINYGSASDALVLAMKAENQAGAGPSASKALAAAVRARAHALLGEPEDAARCLGEAEHLLGRLPGDDAADTWYGYPLQKHLVHASHALTVAGRTSEAAQAQHQALALCKDTSWLTRTLLALDRARCVSRDGDPDGGAQTAYCALTRLRPDLRCGLVLRRAGDMVSALPPAAHTLASVKVLKALVPDPAAT